MIMQISIESLSMIPIYEQIVEQLKKGIINGELTSGSVLPSVRALARELDISALTVKKAYDILEQENFIVVVHGKGTFVAEKNKKLMQEEYQKEVENLLESAIRLGMGHGLEREEIRSIFEMILEEQ